MSAESHGGPCGRHGSGQERKSGCLQHTCRTQHQTSISANQSKMGFSSPNSEEVAQRLLSDMRRASLLGVVAVALTATLAATLLFLSSRTSQPSTPPPTSPPRAHIQPQVSPMIANNLTTGLILECRLPNPLFFFFFSLLPFAMAPSLRPSREPGQC